jgi:putative DNA primase/helicase
VASNSGTLLDLQSLARALNGDVINSPRGREVLAPGPGHSTKDRSMCVRLDAEAPDGFLTHSFAGDDPIMCRDHVRERAGLQPFGGSSLRRSKISDKDIEQAIRTVVHGQLGSKIVAAYDYRDEFGVLLYQVVRYDPKDFRQRRPDGNGGWTPDAGERRVVYRWPELLRFPDATIFVCEGEKDADGVASLGHCATTVASGKWTDDCVKALAGRGVVILEDNDEPGRKKALTAARALNGTAASIRIVALAGLPDKGDVSDWLDANHGNAEKLERICCEAPLWQPDQKTGPPATTPKPRTSSATVLRTVCVADVEAVPIDWVWFGRLARGKLTMLSGDPGIGKSQMAIDIAARITMGDNWMDAGRAPQGNVVILSAEDAIKDTLRPRLEVAGAELRRVHVMEAAVQDGKERSFNLQSDLESLRVKLADIGEVVLVIIDPITSYMGHIDSHRTTDVRAVLEPLARFAEETNIALLAISHPPKATQTKAIYAVTGSLAYVAAARFAFVVVEEPETERRLLLCAKTVAAPPNGIGFRLVQSHTEKGILASSVAWDNAPVTLTANEAVRAGSAGSGKLAEAIEFLNDELAGDPVSADEIGAKAIRMDISEATLRRARKVLNVVAAKEGFQGKWLWSLPK